ncbi:MAG TPA: hypothetical protein DD979_13480 [Gammaproteobacteria bacterium]|nr:hypothetical protein [Gammaproteobacteria bacterium]
MPFPKSKLMLSVALLTGMGLTSACSTMQGLGEDFKTLSAKLNRSGSADKSAGSEPAPTVIKTSQKSSMSGSSRGGYSQDLVKTVQTKLNTLGYQSGEPDGVYTAATETAIQDFQLDNDLAVDGKPSVSLLRVINSQIAQ